MINIFHNALSENAYNDEFAFSIANLLDSGISGHTTHNGILANLYEFSLYTDPSGNNPSGVLAQYPDSHEHELQISGYLTHHKFNLCSEHPRSTGEVRINLGGQWHQIESLNNGYVKDKLLEYKQSYTGLPMQRKKISFNYEFI